MTMTTPPDTNAQSCTIVMDGTTPVAVIDAPLPMAEADWHAALLAAQHTYAALHADVLGGRTGSIAPTMFRPYLGGVLGVFQALYPAYTVHRVTAQPFAVPETPAGTDEVQLFVTHFDDSAVALFAAPVPLTHRAWHALIALVEAQYEALNRMNRAERPSYPQALWDAYDAGHVAVFAYLTGFTELPIGSDFDYRTDAAEYADRAVTARQIGHLAEMLPRLPAPDAVWNAIHTLQQHWHQS